MKEECWKRVFSDYIKKQSKRNIYPSPYQSKVVEGRDPERWRHDAVGNIVSYRLRGCEGCLCHEYDHIVPFSKGGKTEIENCQILQTRSNRYKGNEMNDPKRLTGYSCARKYSEQELDFIEVALYGNIKREGLQCRQFSIYELFDGYVDNKKPPSKQKGLPNCP